jgi:hypothetical protein
MVNVIKTSKKLLRVFKLFYQMIFHLSKEPKYLQSIFHLLCKLLSILNISYVFLDYLFKKNDSKLSSSFYFNDN